VLMTNLLLQWLIEHTQHMTDLADRSTAVVICQGNPWKKQGSFRSGINICELRLSGKGRK
jgi:hypothetical protein